MALRRAYNVRLDAEVQDRLERRGLESGCPHNLTAKLMRAPIYHEPYAYKTSKLVCSTAS